MPPGLRPEIAPVAIAVLLTAPPLLAQSASPDPDGTPHADSIPTLAVEVPLAQGGGPRIDGTLNDRAWAGAPLISGFVQSEPSAGAPASESTEVRVVQTRDALYVGARMTDSEPGGIRAPLARRGADVASDWFVVYLDPAGNGASAVAFAVNPRGVRRDWRIGEDGRDDPEWEAIWEASASMDGTGWTVELRIPFSQVQVEGSSASSGIWGVNFQRHRSQAGEVSSWAPFPRNPRQVVQAFGELRGMEQASSSFNLELVPYSMGRAALPSGGPNEPNPLFGTVGGDLRAALPANLTLTATFNPDFGQVEADPAVVNVSGYRTFFPEKRPFFLEDEGLFTHEIGRTRIFHSRRIGREVQPTAATRSSFQRVPDASGILAASKLSGRTPGGWNLGLMHALTNAEMRVSQDSLGVEELEPLEPRTNYVVARVARNRGDNLGSLGAIATLTHRDLRGTLTEELPSRAMVGGATWYRQSRDGAFELSGALLGSHVTGAPAVMTNLQTVHGRYFQRPDAGHLDLDSLRTSLSGLAADGHVAWTGEGDWSWGLGGNVLSPGFEANDLGYQREADRGHQFAHLSWDRLGEGFLLRRRRLILTQWSDWSFGRERLATGGRADLQLQFRNFWSVIVQGERYLPALSTDHLRGGPALAMPGSTRARAILVTDPRRDLSLRLDGSVIREDETDGFMGVFRATLEAQPAGRLRLALEPSVVDRVREVQYVARARDEGEERFMFGRTDHRTLSLVSRADLALTTGLTLQFYAQPYLVTRQVGEFMELVNPRGPGFADRFEVYDPDRTWLDPETERVHVDRTGDGSSDLSFPDPSFTYGQLSSNLVLRWEYRPGSTLYVVWSRDVRDRASSGSLDPVEGMTDLMGLGRPLPAPATNLLVVKLTFWFNP